MLSVAQRKRLFVVSGMPTPQRDDRATCVGVCGWDAETGCWELQGTADGKERGRFDGLAVVREGDEWPRGTGLVEGSRCRGTVGWATGGC
jgi:hypothetical protein